MTLLPFFDTSFVTDQDSLPEESLEVVIQEFLE